MFVVFEKGKKTDPLSLSQFMKDIFVGDALITSNVLGIPGFTPEMAKDVVQDCKIKDLESKLAMLEKHLGITVMTTPSTPSKQEYVKVKTTK